MLANAPSWQTVLTAWHFSAASSAATGLTALAVLASVGYLRLALRRERRAGRWSRTSLMSWLLAVLTLVISVNGPVAVYAEVLFWVHMVQHLLLIMVVPMLLIWARPLRLVHTEARPAIGAWLDRALHTRLARWLSAPLLGLALYTAVVVLTHLTGFQQVSATHAGVRAFELVLYLVSGWLLFVTLIGAELIPWSLAYLLRFVVLAVAMGVDTMTGVVLMLSSRPLAPVYGSMHPGWGPDLLRDQEIAGAIMWFGGDLLMMLLMILVAVQWGRAGSDRQGLGNWLEGARRRAVLSQAGERGDGELDLDDDQRALDAYNATLAALHGRDNRRKGMTNSE